MRTARSIGAGLGVSMLVAVGTVALSRAQHAGAELRPSTQTRTDTRERLLGLRSEIDVLQVEFDSARANFTKALELVSASELVIFDTVAAGAMQVGSGKDNETSAIIANIRSTGAEGLKGLDSAKFSKAVDALARGEKDAASELIRALKDFRNPLYALVENDRGMFRNSSRELNRKKLELEELEQRLRNETLP